MVGSKYDDGLAVLASRWHAVGCWLGPSLPWVRQRGVVSFPGIGLDRARGL